MASQDGDIDHDLDVEALQAQIDLSLAHTQSLVSSWLKPKYGSQTTSSSRSIQEKELQDILKRPARLGVGAPLPSSTSMVSRDAMKLKGKLAGKKRGREEEDVKQALPSDDEQESKARAITKKARHDPFAPKAKKKASTPAIVPTTASAASSGPSVNVAASQIADSDPKDEGSSSSPKKKKKKHDRLADAPADPLTLPIPSEPKHKSAEESTSSKPSVPAVYDISMNVLQSRTKPTVSPTPSKPVSHTAPLLNLDGPPPATEGSPAKKKRKRNKRKKKKAEGQPGQSEGAPEADPDHDSSS